MGGCPGVCVCGWVRGCVGGRVRRKLRHFTAVSTALDMSRSVLLCVYLERSCLNFKLSRPSYPCAMVVTVTEDFLSALSAAAPSDAVATQKDIA